MSGLSRRAVHIDAERHLARPQSARAGAHRRGAAGTAKAWALLGARAGPPWWSASAAIRPCRRCWPRRLRGIPTVLHEQNAVMGRANRLLAPRVTAIATGFRTPATARPRLQAKVVRQSGARRRDRRGGDALSPRRRRRTAAPAGLRRQPGRARHGRDRAGGDRALAADCARAWRSCSRRAPRTSNGVGGLSRRRRRGRDRALLRATCRPAWRRPSS